MFELALFRLALPTSGAAYLGDHPERDLAMARNIVGLGTVAASAQPDLRSLLSWVDTGGTISP